VERYTVKFERDEDGWWIAEVKEVQGCRSDGRTLRQARERIREALELFDVDPAKVELVDEVKLPAPIRRSVDRARAARASAERATTTAAESMAKTVRVLTREAGLSVRDAAELLGLSFQRVHQLARKGRASRAGGRAPARTRGRPSLRRPGADLTQ
jgi:predicted RNase H-like HicB family nuclease